MDQVDGSQDHSWLLVHGGLVTMGQRDRSGARKVIMIAQREREREEVIEVLTNGATWRRSCGDGHTTGLNRGGQWCSNVEVVLGTSRRDWSRVGAVDN
jgi:hypothetical protein